MFLNDDDMVECPYNKSHRMLRKRLQSHLLKCRLSYPDVELRKCPFNITHLIPEPEFTHHATNCPDRKLITQYKYDAPETKEEEGPKHAPIECDEDWDDTDVADYNPQLYVESANVIRKPEGSNPSCRKVFIKQERKRLGDDDDDDDTDTKNNIMIPASPLNEKQQNNSDDEDDTPNAIKPLKNCYKYDNTNNSSRANWNAGASSYTNLSHHDKGFSSPSCSKRRSRSPNNKSKSARSRSPVNRSYRDRSPLRGSPDYSLRYSPPPNSVRRTLDAYNADEDPYYNGGGRTSRVSNSREAYYRANRDGSEAYYNRSSESSAARPHQPPAPMISYPAPRSNLTRYPPSSNY